MQVFKWGVIYLHTFACFVALSIVVRLARVCLWINNVFFPQDFADITSEPSLDQPVIIEDDNDADMESSSSETSSFLLVNSMSTVVQVHQRLCLSYAQSLWYQPNPSTNHNKEHISALVSSYQITAPLIARFYHLMGMKAWFYTNPKTSAPTYLIIWSFSFSLRLWSGP